MEPAAAAQQTMQCMEIWGGNQVVDTSVSMPGLEAWVYCHPYGDSAGGGGDVHYVSSCATGRVTRLLVADVSGHGAEVCDVAGTLRTLMRRYVNYIDQAEFVRSMNRQFVTMSASHCFATAVVTTFFAPTNLLSLCNAGHPPPLLYRAKTRTWDYLDVRDDVDDEERLEGGDSANLPLGVLTLANYEQLDVTLEPGDLVLCYTDSMPESKDAAGEYLGQAGLLGIVRELDASHPATVIPMLLAAVRSLRAGNLDDDDVTALLFRATGAGVQPRLRDRLLAPARLLGAMLSSLRPGAGPAPLPELTVLNIGGSMFGPLNRLWKGSRGGHAVPSPRRAEGQVRLAVPRPK
jgi:sigma-B regulation protein RsbU (phosphoserine phosphatase)